MTGSLLGGGELAASAALSFPTDWVRNKRGNAPLGPRTLPASTALPVEPL